MLKGICLSMLQKWSFSILKQSFYGAMTIPLCDWLVKFMAKKKEKKEREGGIKKKRENNCGKRSSSKLKIDIEDFPRLRRFWLNSLIMEESNSISPDTLYSGNWNRHETVFLIVGFCVDVPLCDNPTPLEAFKEHSETIVDSNDDSTSSDGGIHPEGVVID
ncbi:hypothetical protein Tco_0712643 [Tanacetum coccineum]